MMIHSVLKGRHGFNNILLIWDLSRKYGAGITHGSYSWVVTSSNLLVINKGIAEKRNTHPPIQLTLFNIILPSYTLMHMTQMFQDVSQSLELLLRKLGKNVSLCLSLFLSFSFSTCSYSKSPVNTMKATVNSLHELNEQVLI